MRWDVANATSVEIDQGIGNVSFSGTRSVSPSVTTTYTLTAHGAGGDATATAEVRINAAAPVCVPDLISPAEGALLDNARYDKQDGLAWNFDWSDCAGASQYHLQAGRGSSTTIDRDDLASSSFHYTREFYIAQLTGWTWKVRAKVGDTWGEWSPARSFELEPVNADPAPASSMRAEISYYDYDASSRWITFKLENTGDAWLECVDAHVVTRVGSVLLYGPEYSNTPFFSSPTQTSGGAPRLASGLNSYLRYKLSGSPGSLGMTATFRVYSLDDRGGPHKTYAVSRSSL